MKAVKTGFYLLVVGVGVLLSYPLTLLVIAWQQAETNAQRIGNYLSNDLKKRGIDNKEKKD